MAASTVVRTPLAEADLDGILTDLDVKNPAADERYATRFTDKADFLSRFPEAGRPRPERKIGVEENWCRSSFQTEKRIETNFPMALTPMALRHR